MSQVYDPIVVLRHADEVPVVARVAMENNQDHAVLRDPDWDGRVDGRACMETLVDRHPFRLRERV